VSSSPGLAPLGQAAGRLVLLRRLTAALADVLTPDDVVRAAFEHVLDVDSVVRAGLATSEGAGRELAFVASDDDSVTPTAVRWCHIDGQADVPVAEAVRTGVPVLVPSPADLASGYPHLHERQVGLGTQRMAALPLLDDERALGALLLSFGAAADFDDDEQAFLGAVAAVVAQAMKRALAYKAQATTSELLQRSLLPESLPDLDGLALGALYEPGGSGVDVGGDWYDVVPLPDGRVALALGDVMGKGVPAAVVMGQVRSALRAYALIDPDPAVVLQRLDLLVASLGVPEQIVTVAYAVVSPSRESLDIAVAGHPAPLLARPGREPHAVVVPPAAALGLRTGSWVTTTVALPPGSLLLFFSDGLVETRSLQLDEGVEELAQRLAATESRRRHPRELCPRLADAMRRHDSDDDVTMLAVLSTVGLDLLTASTQLPADSSATPLARRALAGWLTAWEVDAEVAEAATLCLSELVTNAVIHSGTAPRVTAQLDGERLLVAVQDRGNRGTARRTEDHEPTDISGRGLLLVEALATAWSAEHSADGTTVWFELDTGMARAG
jgi:serine phosphatase RsbU (regulator of sigma subunit)/anti-sigma regulatory factor (Ser/Thr protein kinase)